MQNSFKNIYSKFCFFFQEYFEDLRAAVLVISYTQFIYIFAYRTSTHTTTIRATAVGEYVHSSAAAVPGTWCTPYYIVHNMKYEV